MKLVPIYELKKNLASIIAEAEAGQEITITKHNKPVARLVRRDAEHLHVPSGSGKPGLKPALKKKTAGRYLQILEEDRGTGNR